MPLPSAGPAFGARLGHASAFSPADEQSILSRVGSTALGGLATVGNFLDLPGSMVRDVLSLENPFDQLLSPFTPENRKTGRDVLRDYGMIGHRNTTGNWWGGLGAEMALDPLTYMTFGGSALTKGGKIGQKAGLLDDLTRVAAKKTGQQLGSIGKRQARLTTTLDDLITHGAPGAREAAEDAAKGMGLNLDDLLTKPVGGSVGFGLPFMSPSAVAGTGRKSQKLASVLDDWSINPLSPGNKILDMKLPGTDVAPIGALYREFNPWIQGGKTPLGRELGRLFTRGREAVGADARGVVAHYTNRLVDMGKATAEQGRELRRMLELPEAYATASPQMKKLIDEMKGDLDFLIEGQQSRAIPIEKYLDPESDYFPRHSTSEVISGTGGKVYSGFDPHEMKRLEHYHGIKGATEKIKDITSDPRLNELIDSGAELKTIREELESRFSDVFPSEWRNPLNADGTPKKTRPIDAFAEHLAKLPPEVRAAGMFNNHPLIDFYARVKSAKDSMLGADTFFEGLTQPKLIRPSIGREETGVAVGKLLQEAGLDVDKAKGILAEKLGVAPSSLRTAVVDKNVAEDLGRYMKAWQGPEAVGDIMKIYDNITNLTKGALTSPWPAFHVRNFTSAMFNNWVAGTFSARSVKEAHDIMSGKEVKGAAEIPIVQRIAEKRGFSKVVRPVVKGKTVDTIRDGGKTVLRQDGKVVGEFESVLDYNSRAGLERLAPEAAGQPARKLQNVAINNEFRKQGAGSRLILEHLAHHADTWFWNKQISESGASSLKKLAEDGLVDLRGAAEGGEFVAKITPQGQQYLDNLVGGQFGEVTTQMRELDKNIQRFTDLEQKASKYLDRVGKKLSPELNEQLRDLGTNAKWFQPGERGYQILRDAKVPEKDIAEFAKNLSLTEQGKDVLQQLLGERTKLSKQGRSLGMRPADLEKGISKIARQPAPAKQLTDAEATKILGELIYAHSLVGKFQGEFQNVAGSTGAHSRIEDLTSEIMRPVNHTADDLLQPGIRRPSNTKINYADDTDLVLGSGPQRTTREEVASSARKLLGTDNPEDVIAAAGVPDGAEVTLNAFDDSIVVNYELPDGTFAERSIVKEPDGRIVVRNENLEIPTGERGGTGIRMFNNQVRSAAALGVDEIQMLAAGRPGSTTNGYNTWARFGVDAPLTNDNFSPVVLAKLRKDGYGDLKRVSDFMKSKKLQEYWRENGASFEGAFDLSEGSLSRKMLDEYIPKRFPKGESNINFGRTARRAVGMDPGTTLNPIKASYRGVGEATESTLGPMAAGHDVGNYVEGLARIAPFIKQIREGVDPLQAKLGVGAAQVDYANRFFTKTEQQIMQRAFPFWKFSSRMVPWTLQQLSEKPGGKLAQTIRATNSARDPGQMVPDYVSETASIPVEGTPLESILGAPPEGNQRFVSGLGLAVEDPLSFIGGGTRGAGLEALSRMNPMLKGPLEWATGESFFQKGPMGGRDLEDLDPVIGRTLANITGKKKPVDLPDIFEHIMSNSPASRVLTTARTLTDTRKSLGAKAANLGTGFRVTDVSPAARDAVMQERSQALMRDLGAKNFSVTYFRDEDLESMTPEQRELARLLEGLMNLTAAKKRERAKAEKK